MLGDALRAPRRPGPFPGRGHEQRTIPGTGVTIRDVLPPALTYDAAAAGGDGTSTRRRASGRSATSPLGASRQFTFVVTTTQLGPFTNLASLDRVSPADNNPSNDSDSAGILVRAPIADLVVIKGVIPEEAVVGQTVTYAVAASRTAGEPCGCVRHGRRPGRRGAGAGSSRIEPVGQGGTFDEATLRWDIGTMAPGAWLHVTRGRLVRAEGTQINTVTIDAPALTDPHPGEQPVDGDRRHRPAPARSGGDESSGRAGRSRLGRRRAGRRDRRVHDR